MSKAIIICSRVHSSRVPGKCFVKYQGTPQIEHLIARLMDAELPIYVAVPEEDKHHYMYLMDKFPKRVFISTGYSENPLARTHAVAQQNGIKSIVRITHDKMFVESKLINPFIEKLESEDLDYVYSSDFIPGTGFEVISFAALEKAYRKYSQNIEHISYAIKAITDKTYNYPLDTAKADYRLLIDYPEDVQLMDILFSTLGHNCTLDDVKGFLNDHYWVRQINRLPEVTIYTCAYNAEKWISEAMGSVAVQAGFRNFEYIIIDDASTDKTLFHIGKFCHLFKNARFYKNIKNIGLAASSNRALKLARGKYIMRLDADDYFSNRAAITEMIAAINTGDFDVVYPDCYLGVGRKEIQKGSENHHCGGALFKTSAINHIKFTDSLRGYEGLDVFMRAKDQLKIGYYEAPMFVYRQTPGSMSKTDLAKRKQIKQEIMSKVVMGTL